MASPISRCTASLVLADWAIAGKSVCEDLPVPGRLTVGKRYEADVKPGLRVRHALRRDMASDKGAVAVRIGGVFPVTEQQVVRRPVAGKPDQRRVESCSYRPQLFCETRAPRINLSRRSYG